MGLSRLPAPLLVITDRGQAQRPLIEIVEEALLGGCRWVSLREKDLSREERMALVQQILPLVRRFGGTLLVHDDISAAKVADGVHLPANGNVAQARNMLGENACIGLSCHTLDDVARARDADYVTLGPVAPTRSKPGYVPQLGADDFRDATRYGMPVVALGGVDETNVRALKEAGARGFAIMGSVMRSDAPQDLVRRMLGAWGENS